MGTTEAKEILAPLSNFAHDCVSIDSTFGGADVVDFRAAIRS